MREDRGQGGGGRETKREKNWTGTGAADCVWTFARTRARVRACVCVCLSRGFVTAPMSVHIPAHLLWMKRGKLCVCVCARVRERGGDDCRMQRAKSENKTGTF